MSKWQKPVDDNEIITAEFEKVKDSMQASAGAVYVIPRREGDPDYIARSARLVLELLTACRTEKDGLLDVPERACVLLIAMATVIASIGNVEAMNAMMHGVSGNLPKLVKASLELLIDLHIEAHEAGAKIGDHVRTKAAEEGNGKL